MTNLRDTIRMLVCIVGFSPLLSVGALVHAANQAKHKPVIVTQPFVQGLSDPVADSMPETARLELIAAKRPTDPKAHLAAAHHYMNQAQGADSRLSDASRHVDAVLKGDSMNIEALMLAADIANRRGQPATASLHFRNATQVDPNSKDAWIGLAGALDKAGDHVGAEVAFGKFRMLSGMPAPP